MLQISLFGFGLYSLGVLVGGLCLGWGLGYCRRIPLPTLRPEWGERTGRDLEESRWREGSAVDGQFRGLRWLPRIDGERE